MGRTTGAHVGFLVESCFPTAGSRSSKQLRNSLIALATQARLCESKDLALSPVSASRRELCSCRLHSSLTLSRLSRTAHSLSLSRLSRTAHSQSTTPQPLARRPLPHTAWSIGPSQRQVRAMLGANSYSNISTRLCSSDRTSFVQTRMPHLSHVIFLTAFCANRFRHGSRHHERHRKHESHAIAGARPN